MPSYVLGFTWVLEGGGCSSPIRSVTGGLELPGQVSPAGSPGPGLALLHSPGIPLLTPIL